MRLRQAIVVVLVGLAAAGGWAASAGAAGSATVVCGPAGARTLATSSVARVYVSGPTVFGCSEHSQRTLTLGDASTCIFRTMIGPAVVKGELAAYGTRDCGVDTGVGGLVVQRLDTGRVLHNRAAISGLLGAEGYSWVASVVLQPDGSAAWIGTGHAIGPPHQVTEVHEVTTTGARLLDSGRGIAPRSLRLRGSRLSWRDGHRTRTATLR